MKTFLNRIKGFFIKFNIPIGITLSLIGIWLAFFPPNQNPSIVFYYDWIDLIKVNESNENLRVYYRGEDIQKKGLNLRVFSIKIKNNGRGDVRIADYDPTIPFGMEIKNGFVTDVEVLESNDNDPYLKDNIFSGNVVDSNKIILNQKMIKSNQSVRIKFTVLHFQTTPPQLIPMGRIANSSIIISSDENDDNYYDWLLLLVGTVIFIIGIYILTIALFLISEFVTFIKHSIRKQLIKTRLAHNYDANNKTHRLMVSIYSILGRKQFKSTIKLFNDLEGVNKKIEEENRINETIEYYYKLAKEKRIKAPSNLEKTYHSDFLEIIHLINEAGLKASLKTVAIKNREKSLILKRETYEKDKIYRSPDHWDS